MKERWKETKKDRQGTIFRGRDGQRDKWIYLTGIDIEIDKQKKGGSKKGLDVVERQDGDR